MNNNTIINEIQLILRGESQISNSTLIQAIASNLGESNRTSKLAKEDKQFKAEETERLTAYINSHQLWNCNINFNAFISEGAEQRVYILDNSTVLKLNDAIYYQSWLDYFNNLLLHNYFFPDTSYLLKGFYKSDKNIIYALVSQNYVEATEPTDLKEVKMFLEKNGFQNTKNNDYYNYELKIILEDLHDENVLTKDGLLYFIDTVFYIH